MGAEWVFPFSMPACLMYETLWYRKVNGVSSRTGIYWWNRAESKSRNRQKERSHIEAADLFGENIVRFVTKS